MTTADWIGSAGVALLLGAFAASSAGWTSAASRRYQAANAVGAGLAAAASYLIGYWPFVVLESIWAAVAVIALARRSTPNQ